MNARAAAAYVARWRLSTRLVVMSVVLLLLLQGASFLALRVSVVRNGTAALGDQLVVAERIWQRLLEQRAAKLGQGAALLAADYGFRSALASGDRDTITSALENHGRRIDASVSGLLDRQLQLQGIVVKASARAHGASALAHGSSARAHAASDGTTTDEPTLADRGQRDLLRQVTDTLADGRASFTIAMMDGRPFQFVMAPVRAPLVIGWVVMGFEIDQPLLDELHAVSGMHGTLLVPADAAASAGLPADERVLATTLPDAGVGPQLSRRVVLSGRSTGALSAASAGLSSGLSGTASLQLTGSIDKAVAPFAGLQWAMGLIALAGLALFAVASAWSARRVRRPLADLVVASQRLGGGDYNTKVDAAAGSGEVRELAGAFEAMRSNIAAQQGEIRQLAYWDKLTGLPNRAQFVDTLAHTIAAAAAAPSASLAVVMLDLDRFKQVNDVLGYDVGDRLLQGMAARLQVVVRTGDVLARLGGDEFVLMLQRANVDTAQDVALRIAAAFEVPLNLDEQSVDIGAGIGIACWPMHGADGQTLLKRAELAMAAAKRQGDGAKVFTPALESLSADTLSLSSELRQAVDGGELRLYLQPKIDVASGELCGAEALVRWQHPQRGLLGPMQFVPFAEQTGLIRRITLWVFEAVVQQQAALAALGVGRVSINLSTRDLVDTDLPDKLDAILAKHQGHARGLCLEITESAIMDDPSRAQSILQRLAQQGFKLSIDDFGTGYSSLAYLKQLAVHELKIDKSFVMAMESQPNDAKIVRSTVDLAHGLGLAVVAEGVENAQIFDALAALGCDEAQGFHFAKPLPVDAFAAWVAQHGAQRVEALKRALEEPAWALERTAQTL